MRRIVAAFLLCAFAQLACAQAPASKTINAITFGGGYNLPAWIAQRQG